MSLTHYTFVSAATDLPAPKKGPELKPIQVNGSMNSESPVKSDNGAALPDTNNTKDTTPGRWVVRRFGTSGRKIMTLCEFVYLKG